MIYSPEFDFFLEILTDFKLSFRILQSSEDLELFFSGFLQPMDKGKTIEFSSDFEEFSNQFKQKIIYRIRNFRFHFLLIQLPDAEGPVYLSVGPYLLPDIPSLHQFVTPENASKDIPTLGEDQQLLGIVNIFIKRIFRESDHIPIVNLKIPESANIHTVTDHFDFHSQEDTLLTIRAVEEHYDNENELMKLVSQGQWHKAETYLSTIVDPEKHHRIFPGENTLNTQKIKSFALNTLLRKAVESVDVHPIHIENLYGQLILKIIDADSLKEIRSVQREIVRKYCELVQIHSLKGYSPIIQKVLTHITTNLSGDLTLNTQAEMLNINPSYLSVLFKKETGTTLTDYVKQKRVNHAVFLLSTTSLQIQTIAECCGISDVNYFTKIFKKIIGKTPKEYRDHILK